LPIIREVEKKTGNGKGFNVPSKAVEELSVQYQ
jgi:hypothetical protein